MGLRVTIGPLSSICPLQWAVGMATAYWGVLVLRDEHLLSHTYDPLIRMLPEDVWAWLAICAGVVQVLFSVTERRIRQLVCVADIISAALWVYVASTIYAQAYLDGLPLWPAATSWGTVGAVMALTVVVLENINGSDRRGGE